MLRISLAALLALLWLSPAQAISEDELLPVDEAFVLSAAASGRDRITFSWKIAPGYYLYRHRMGVQPTDASFQANPLQLPDGKKYRDEFFGDVETYRGQVTALQTGAAASGVTTVSFKVKYQGCADLGICYPPQTRTLAVSLPAPAGAAQTATALAGGIPVATRVDPTDANPVSLLDSGEALPAEQAFRVEAIALSSSELLARLTPAPGYYLYRDKTTFRIVSGEGVTLGAPRFPAGQPYRDEHFGEVTVYFDPVEIPVPLVRHDKAGQTISLEASFQGCLKDGICYPPMTRTLQVALPAGAGASTGATEGETGVVAGGPAAESGVVSLLLALLLAFAGGLILNLMPCVLPVLSFKAMGLAQGGASHGHARAHALWYTLGVLASFAAIGAAVLALRGAGHALGWGFQLQQAWLVGALALLMFAIGLSLSGLWQFGAGLANVGQSLTEKSGATGDFFTGVLAVVVASPCTAPFMGSALGYAFTAPPILAMLVFLALGLGLALPFLLIGFLPALASRLPKPGAWMDTLKQWLAYPMYFTAVWLAWVFGKQRGMDAMALLLIGAVLLTLGLWWFERQRLDGSPAKKLLAWLLLALALAAFVAATRVPASSRLAAAEDGIVPYSAQALATLRADGRPVFVDMTADWCITCKVNEKAVLHTAAFKQLLRETNTVYMVGDWTNQDQAISAFLDEYRAPGVPLYVVFPADGGPGVKLPQVLTAGLMRKKLEAAAAK